MTNSTWLTLKSDWLIHSDWQFNGLIQKGAHKHAGSQGYNKDNIKVDIYAKQYFLDILSAWVID